MAGFIYKIKNTESTVNTTPSTVNNATLVRILNQGANVVVTQNVVSTNTTLAMTVPTGMEVLIYKAPLDTLVSSTNTLATPIAIRD